MLEGSGLLVSIPVRPTGNSRTNRWHTNCSQWMHIQ